MRATDCIARAFSTMFHPLLMPTIGIFILFQLNTYVSFSLTPEARRFIMLIIFLNTALVPVFSILVLKHTGYIRDLLLDSRGERILPLTVAAVMFFLTYYLLLQTSLPSLIYFFVMGGTILVLLSLMVSFLWKISLHMVSLGGVTGFLIITALLLRIEVSWMIASVFLVSGLTGASRIHLKAHSPAQVYTGYLLGVAAMLLLFLYLKT